MDPSWIRSVCLSFSSNKFTFDLFDIYIIIFGMRYIDQLIVGRWCDTWVVVNCHCIFERHLSIRPSMRAWLLFNIVYIDIIALSSTQLNEWSLIMLQLINQLYPNQFFSQPCAVYWNYLYPNQPNMVLGLLFSNCASSSAQSQFSAIETNEQM